MKKLKLYRLRKWIEMRSEQWQVPIPIDWESKLQFYEKKYGVKLNWLNDDTFLSMSRTFGPTPNFNMEWAAHILLLNDPRILTAFEMTVGHERSHELGKLGVKNIRCCRDKKFVRWVDEVHADFGACVQMPHISRDDMVFSMKYKLKVKLDATGQDRETNSHPSWKRRINYIQNYNYNEELIRVIAADVGCRNEKLIVRLVNMWPDIYPT